MQASSSPASRHQVMKSLFIYYFVQVLRFLLLSCSYWPFLLFLLSCSYYLTVLLLMSCYFFYCLTITVLLLLSCRFERNIVVVALTVLIVWIWYQWLNLSLIFPLMSMSPHSNRVTVLLFCLFILSCFVGLLVCCLAGLLVVALIVSWFVAFGSLDLKQWNSMMLETLIIYILSN
jgi:hypothetical protein